MKEMTCKQLGGTCDEIFQADSYEVMRDLHKTHMQQKANEGDEAHAEAMQKLKQLFRSPCQLHDYFQEKRELFDNL